MSLLILHRIHISQSVAHSHRDQCLSIVRTHSLTHSVFKYWKRHPTCGNGWERHSTSSIPLYFTLIPHSHTPHHHISIHIYIFMINISMTYSSISLLLLLYISIYMPISYFQFHSFHLLFFNSLHHYSFLLLYSNFHFHMLFLYKIWKQ